MAPKKSGRGKKKAAVQEPILPKDDHPPSRDDDDDDEEEDEDILPSSSSLPATDDSAADAAAAAEAATSCIPPQKFFAMDKVVARDRDGVIYDAVIRRAVYGSAQAEPIQLGLCSHAEAQALIQEASDEDEPPCWHYFVHYTKWNSAWDRWVADYDVYEPSEKIRRYANRIMQEHKALRQDMTKKVKGKKSFQTIDGTKFLQEWRKRISKVDVELGILNPRFTTATELQQQQEKLQAQQEMEKAILQSLQSSSSSSSKRKETNLLAERQLREKGLTKCEDSTSANKIISLPFELKRICVEQWEIITQCGMLTHLPASVTVRDALDEYLKSKGVDRALCHSLEKQASATGKKLTQAKGTMAAPESPSKKTNPEAAETENKDMATNDADKMDVEETKQKPDDPAPAPTPGDNKDEVPKTPEQLDEERAWIDMANGIAQFFDEALPYRLLYREEYAQLRVVQRTAELADKPYSAIYGPEYLLRMLSRLPGLLVKDLPPEENRPILAKLNDLARFLHKNQSSFFAAYHRKPNGDEQMEALRMEARLQKKRAKSCSVPPEKTKPEKKPKVDGVVAAPLDKPNYPDEPSKESISTTTEEPSEETITAP